MVDDLRNWSPGMLARLRNAKVAWFAVFACATVAGSAVVFWKSERRALDSASPVPVAGADASRRSTVDPPLRTFVGQLPAGLSIEPLLREIQRHAAAENVVFGSADANTVLPTDQSLAQLHVTLALRGQYAGIKATLGQVFARHPNLVVQRLQLRQGAAPGDVEASVAVVLLGQPLSPSSLPGERR